MSRHVALLRGVNVGGNKGVPMSALKGLAERLSLGSPRTLLQSGNLVFSSTGEKPEALERVLEQAIQADIGVTTQVCVRTAAVWDKLVQANPFPESARDDPAHLQLMAFKTPPKAGGPEAIAEVYQGPKLIALAHGHAYIVYPEGMGTSKLTPALLARHLGQGTSRNWNTVLKLQRLLAEG